MCRTRSNSLHNRPFFSFFFLLVLKYFRAGWVRAAAGHTGEGDGGEGGRRGSPVHPLWSYPTKVFHSTDKLGLKGRNSGRPGRDTWPGVLQGGADGGGGGAAGLCVYGAAGALVHLHCVSGVFPISPRAQNASGLLAFTTVLDAASLICVCVCLSLARTADAP